MTTAATLTTGAPGAPDRARRYLLFIAGMGGLLYGIDVGIIAGALPYLESTATLAWKLTTQQLSFIVAAVLLGSVLSSLFAGALADLIGRRWAMVLAGALFTLSIPMIALSNGYLPLLLGRLLQGVSGGLIGVVVPLYLAESLPAAQRGRGAALFQLMLTIGLVGAAVIGLSQARNVDAVAQAAAALDPAQRSALVFAAQDHAWRTIFWLCLAPGLLFTLGSLALKESPRWLALRAGGRVKGADAAAAPLAPVPARDSLASRRYVLPFLLACLVLALTQATGINSVLAYVVTILNQAGLPGATANTADVALKVLNAVMTVVAVVLVDRKGRKFLLMLGSGAIVVALVSAGLLFRGAESRQVDVHAQVEALVRDDSLALRLDESLLAQLGAQIGAGGAGGAPQQLTVAYAYGPFTNVKSLRSDDPLLPTVQLRRVDAIQEDSVIGATLRRWGLNPFADPAEGRAAPLTIARLARDRAGRSARLAGDAGDLPVRGRLRGGPGRMRVAGPVRTDADPDPLERHEHRPPDQPVRLDPDRGHVPAHRRLLRLLDRLLRGCGLLGAVLPDGRLPAARDQGQDAGRDRAALQWRRTAAGDLNRAAESRCRVLLPS